MAAAHVTGAVALYVAQHRSATPAEAKAYLLKTAQQFVVGAPGGTTRRSLWVGPESATPAPEPEPQPEPVVSELPSFLRFALFSDTKVEIKKYSVVGKAGGSVNADVHANVELKLENETPRAYGFGSYGEKLSGDAGGVFNPVLGVPGKPALAMASTISFSAFDADAFAGYATRSIDGDLKLTESITLGTADAPVFFYVDGKVSIEKPITIHGYGAIFANDNVTIKQNLLGDGDGGRVGIFSTKDISMDNDVVAFATLVAGGSVETGDRSTVVGGIYAVDLLRVKQETTVTYRPLLARIVDLFW
jgi:hypothetical protein